MSHQFSIRKGSLKLLTAGKYCEQDIIVTAEAETERLVEYDQQNPLVTQYLAASTGYSAEDYSVTVMTLDYMYATPGYTKWHPVGSPITVSTAGVLHLTDGDKVLVKTVEAGDQVLVNCAPGRIAHWWLTVAGEVTQCGTVKPSGKVRMINTAAINVRDLGGWDCDGGTVKYGKLFRGALLTEADAGVLVDQLGIRHDLDLRGTSDNDGITASPLGSEIRYTVTDGYPWYSLTYDGWAEILRKVFDAVAHDEPLIFHCRQGADRTGTVACVLEALLGVSQTDCDRDYELTTLAGTEESPCQRIRTTEDKWVQLIGEITAKSGDTFRDKVVNWCGNSLGLTAEEINAFRRSMIDGEPEDVVIEDEETSDYIRLEWVRIVESEGSRAVSHVRTKLSWSEVNKIECKIACTHNASTKDMLFATYDGATIGSAPFIATQSSYMLSNSSGLTNYAVSPSNIPNTTQTPQEYVITFTGSNTNPIKFGGWGDATYSHPHNWYYVRFYKDDTLLAEFLPCYHKDDPTAGGFLETVSGEFYLDAGRANVGFAVFGPEL